jgi:hypothetical protein
MVHTQGRLGWSGREQEDAAHDRGASDDIVVVLKTPDRLC